MGFNRKPPENRYSGKKSATPRRAASDKKNRIEENRCRVSLETMLLGYTCIA
jgi:hypothetical protein